jgi:hypothetical protein
MLTTRHLAMALGLLALLAGPAHAKPGYAWPSAKASAETLSSQIPPPDGFVRTREAAGSWAEWLRGLPMKSKNAWVMTYRGLPKWRQDVHVAVVDIDIGTRDLQQCADAVMRLRAEWLYASGRAKEIAFNDTDGKRRRFAAQSKQDYAAFRKYMDLVFAYAGTWSLERELKPVEVADIRIGDVFIKGGFPGHAVLVADMAENPKTGEKRFLLTQSYMPAQDIHVLKNPNAADGSPWYALDFGPELKTPEWNFPATALKRFT